MRLSPIVLVLAALLGLMIAGEAWIDPFHPAPLRNVYTPTFQHGTPHQSVSKTLRQLRSDLRTPTGRRLVEQVLPDEGGVLWIVLIVVFAVGFDFARPRSARNVDLIALLVPGFLFFHVIALTRLWPIPAYFALTGWVFGAVFAVTSFLLVRALWRIRHPFRAGWRPGLSRKALITIAGILIVLDATKVLLEPSDDAGFFVNLGAQRLRERGAMPYGDPLLTGSPGAAYGPVLYLAQVPFQLAVSPARLNAESPDQPVLGDASRYLLPAPLAGKLCTLTFHLVGLTALWLIGRRWGGEEVGWALVALYCGSAGVLGIGGDIDMKRIGGMTYVSHIGPPALCLAAFAALPRPALAGGLLAAAAGAGLYPAFLVPAWFGYFWNDRRRRWHFLVGLVATGLVIGIPVLLMTHPAPGHGVIGTILSDTFGHHTDPEHYGSSPYGFWAQHGDRERLVEPLVAGSPFTAPVVLALYAFSVAAFWVARRKSPAQLALLTGAIAIAAQLVKIHSTASYIAWYYPFLLIGLFVSAEKSEAAAERAADPDVAVEPGAASVDSDRRPRTT